MAVRHLRAVKPVLNSGVEPRTGLLSGQGAHMLTATVPGAVMTELPLGELGFIGALLDRAEHSAVDVDVLAPLRRGNGSIPVADLPAVTRSLRELIEAVGAELGWALMASTTGQPPACTRALPATAPPTVLLATPTASVSVDPDGLRLRLRGLTVLGWRRDGEQMLLQLEDGDYALRTSSISAALLRRLGNGHTQATLVRRPLHDLAAPLFAGMNTAARLAPERGVPVQLARRQPLRGRYGATIRDEPAYDGDVSTDGSQLLEVRE